MFVVGLVVCSSPSSQPVGLERGHELGAKEQAEVGEPEDGTAKFPAKRQQASMGERIYALT